MSGGSGIGGDVMGGLQTVGGAFASIMGYPQLGVPLMMNGVGTLSGGGSGGGLGGLGSLFGMGGGPAQQQPLAQPFQPKGGASNANAIDSAIGPGGIGTVGPNAPGLAALGPTASFGAPYPPPDSLSPAGGGASPTSLNAYLSARGGGPDPNQTTPINNQALSASLSGANTQQDLSAANPATPWYQDAATLQAMGPVGAAYLKYLTESGKNELAKPFSSTVIGTPMNPLAPVKSSPIQPPPLVV